MNEKQYWRWQQKRRGLYYKEGLARTEPVATETRQQLRRGVILALKHRRYRWAHTGVPSHPKGPTPKRLARPKGHRWLEAARHG